MYSLSAAVRLGRQRLSPWPSGASTCSSSTARGFRARSPAPNTSVLKRRGFSTPWARSGSSRTRAPRNGRRRGVPAPNGAPIRGEFLSGHGYQPFRERGLSVRREVLDAILIDRAALGRSRARRNARTTLLIEEGIVRGAGCATPPGARARCAAGGGRRRIALGGQTAGIVPTGALAQAPALVTHSKALRVWAT